MQRDRRQILKGLAATAAVLTLPALPSRAAVWPAYPVGHIVSNAAVESPRFQYMKLMMASHWRFQLDRHSSDGFCVVRHVESGWTFEGFPSDSGEILALMELQPDKAIKRTWRELWPVGLGAAYVGLRSMARPHQDGRSLAISFDGSSMREADAPPLFARGPSLADPAVWLYV
jgi:hypothetical protein